MAKIYLEISLEKDKRDVAAIMVANGYSVKLETISNGKGRGKKMLAIWKDEEFTEEDNGKSNKP